jgi:hypothetical protein
MKCKGNSVLYVKEIMPQHQMCSRCDAPFMIISHAGETQQGLDNPPNMYIIILTHERRCSGDLTNAEQDGQKVQARRPPAARHAQSASRRGDRPSVRSWRFLRSRRPSATQVRDASPRHGEQAVGHSVRYSIRLLTPYLLSSGSRLSTRWALWPIAREAGATARPQTHAGGSGLRPTTPGERSFVAPFRLGRCYPETIRFECSSTEYRARTQAAGKKTSLNPVGSAPKVAERETLISAYEDLRRQATHCSSSGGLGMAIFLGQGMAAWMLACSWVASTNPDNVRRYPIAAAPLPDELRGEIVLVLAAMALKQAPEVHP